MTQLLQCSAVWHTLDLHPVALGFVGARVSELVLVPSIAGQYEQALAVSVQSSSSVHPRHIDMVGQGGATIWVGERGQNPKGLVEQDDGRHAATGLLELVIVGRSRAVWIFGVHQSICIVVHTVVALGS